MTHNLKCWPEFFEAMIDGTKTFEVRKCDRDFKVGDTLCLREYDPEAERYTHRSVYRRVTYILPGGSFGVEYGYCVMGLEML